MKIKCSILLDTETNEYELKFSNISHPGEGIDYNELMKVLKNVFIDVDKQIEITGIDSTDNFTKSIN